MEMRLTDKVSGCLQEFSDMLMNEYVECNPTLRPSSVEKARSALNCILHNMATSVMRKEDRVHVCFHNRIYANVLVNGKKEKRKLSAVYVRAMCDWLCDQYDCVLELGGTPIKTGFRMKYEDSYITIGEELYDEIESLHVEKSLFKPLDNVLLLKDKDKKPMAFQLTDDLKLIIDNLNKYNELSKRVDVTLYDDMNVQYDLQLRKVYNNSEWTQGGRNYLEAGVVQVMSGTQRQRLCIDSEGVSEIDYKALHPSIIAELEGVDISGHDPYGIQLDGYAPDLLREISKLALLIMINCKNPQSARTALNYKLSQTYDISGLYGAGKLSKPSVDVRLVLDSIIDLNPYLSAWLFTGSGLRLQNIDSKIMDHNINWFTQRGELCIPIHDSIILKESLTKTGKEVMVDSYQHVLGSKVNCKLEEK